MANMSYCRFENTATDLKDCINAVQDAIENGETFAEFFKGLGTYEQTAFRHLLQYANEFQEAVEELKEYEPEGVEFDNEMDA